MKVAIIGASGFVGKNLMKHILTKTTHEVIAVASHTDCIKVPEKFINRVTLCVGDVLNRKDVEKMLDQVDVVVYLVHMMASKDRDYADLESKAAEIVGRIAKLKNIKRFIYLSGLGNSRKKLSKHLTSRHNTGDIFRKYIKNVLEFRASMIIGPGSISFEIVRDLIYKLPVIPLPYSVMTKTQPIGLNDVLNYLNLAIEREINGHEIIEIGGPEQMTYLDFLKLYSRWLGKKNIFLCLRVMPTWGAWWWLYLFTSKNNARVGSAMIPSFHNEMIVTNRRAQILFPEISSSLVEESFFK
jgi:uncharacterized protein YbjT (DUF2867 family)